METTRMIAACGLVCTVCPARKAWAADDNALRETTAKEWSAMFGADIKAESINCSGCLEQTGPKFSHCADCDIRACVTGKKTANCGKCGEYAGCAKISEFIKMVPAVKAVLDAERG